MIKKKIALIAFATLLAFSLTACLGGGSSEPTRYYTIAVENISLPSAGAFADKRLQVRKFTIWASRPEHMLAQVAGEYITKSGLFKSVETKSSGKPDYELLGNVVAIEEVDEGSSQSAHLTIGLTFKNVQSGAVLWEGKCDKSKPTNSREPRVTAEALSKILAECMDEALKGIASAE